MIENRKHILLASLAIWIGGSLAFQALRILLSVTHRQALLSIAVFIVAFAIYHRRTRQKSVGTFFIVACIAGALSFLNFFLSIPLLSQLPLAMILMAIVMRFVAVMMSAVLGLALAWLIGKFPQQQATLEEMQEEPQPNQKVDPIN